MQQRAVFRNCTSVCDVKRAIAMDIFFDSILIVMELIGLFTIADVYFEQKFDGKKSKIFAIAIYVSCFELLGKFLNLIGTAPIKSVIVIIEFYVLIRLCYHGRRLKAIVFGWNILCFTICGRLSCDGGKILLLLHMDIDTLYNSQYAYIVAALLAKSILLYSCVVFTKRLENSRRDEKFSVLEWGQLLIVPICMILNLMIVVYDLIQNDNLTFVFCFWNIYL